MAPAHMYASNVVLSTLNSFHILYAFNTREYIFIENIIEFMMPFVCMFACVYYVRKCTTQYKLQRGGVIINARSHTKIIALDLKFITNSLDIFLKPKQK